MNHLHIYQVHFTEAVIGHAGIVSVYDRLSYYVYLYHRYCLDSISLHNFFCKIVVRSGLVLFVTT
jgi:hypothetical protein